MKDYKNGMYAWGGPGTIRLIETKYHTPLIDKESFLTLYDDDRLKQAKKVFDLSDVWVTFSWGFSEETEKEDYTFIQERLFTIKKNGLRSHAYVQGLNVVEREYLDEDIYCRDLYGRRLPYSKGRKLICPNNPQARKILIDRVRRAVEYHFDGVFVDNMLFGLPPAFVRSNFAPFFGCFCRYCREKFYQQFSYKLNFSLDSQQHLHDYLQFRSDSIESIVGEISSLAHTNNKFFGINLFDPCQMNSNVYFGYDLAAIGKHLDYYFIENHSLPSKNRSNTQLVPLIASTHKPVIVLSYDKGIGFENEFSQDDFNCIKSEASLLGYKPCYKVSEYTTAGKWQTLHFSSLKSLSDQRKMDQVKNHQVSVLQSKRSTDGLLASAANIWMTTFVSAYFENWFVNRIGHFLYKRSLYSWKNFSFDLQ